MASCCLCRRAWCFLVIVVAVCGAWVSLMAMSSSASDENQPTFLVKPYLQLPTETGMTVMWETDTKLPSIVEFGTGKELNSRTEIATPTILHEVRLAGLKPGTTYSYRVRSGKLVSETYKFKTAPPAGTRRFRVALYGDSRTNSAVHRKVAEQIAKSNVDLILHTGDIVTNGRDHDSWRKQFFEPLEPVAHTVPWVSTIGNHEQDSEHYFSYMALPGNERYFGFDYANLHVVCVDSNGWIEKGRDSKQYQWLAEHLREKRDATWTFVAFHHPLFSAHATRPIASLRWDWAPLFLDPENRVDAVVTGHDHFYARNYRMGRLADKPQPGVLFMTSAGGGASLYRTKQRDYIAREKAVHHFTLFDFDGDQATVTPIDITGTIIDRYTLTKKPTPPDQFCAYEIEELRQFLRKALAAAPVQPAPGDRDTTIDTKVSVPTRFRVPVAGQLRWKEALGWKMKNPIVDFKLKPGETLEIPLQAEVAAGAFPKSPALVIAFEPGRFVNRTIEVFPFKLSGPERVVVGQAKVAPIIDGILEKAAWTPPAIMLQGLPPGGRGDQVQFLADENWLYLGARLDDPSGNVQINSSRSEKDRSKLVLQNEHVRLVIWDGKQIRSFAITPELARYSSVGKAEDGETPWRAATSRASGAWCVEIAVPRKLVPDLENVRVNVVHRRRVGRDFVDLELCPTFGMGENPDVIPDWRPIDAKDRFARLHLE